MSLPEEPEKSSGLYKVADTGELLYAPTRVSSKTVSLSVKTAKPGVTVDGWQWFASRAEAEAAYGIEPADETYCGQADCPERLASEQAKEVMLRG